MILLDTHVLLWLITGDTNLGKKSRALIDKHYHNTQSQQLAVSAITFWEIALLKQKARIEFDEDVTSWRKEILRQGLLEIQISGHIAVISTTLDNFHADPADRFIVSSALLNNASLITADRKILGWKGDVDLINAKQ